jgi:hypothetical protein
MQYTYHISYGKAHQDMYCASLDQHVDRALEQITQEDKLSFKRLLAKLKRETLRRARTPKQWRQQYNRDDVRPCFLPSKERGSLFDPAYDVELCAEFPLEHDMRFYTIPLSQYWTHVLGCK